MFRRINFAAYYFRPVLFGQSLIFLTFFSAMTRFRAFKHKYSAVKKLFSTLSEVQISLNSISTKGQLISKCPFGFIVWTKNQRNYFWISVLSFFCSFLGASWKLFGLPGDLNKEAYRKPKKASRKLPGRYKKTQGRNSEIIRWYFCPNDETKKTF